MSVLGIDIGGTNIRALAVDGSGRILGREHAATTPKRGPGETIDEIMIMVRKLQEAMDERVAAIGIGVTGPVDPFTGIVSNPFTLGGWPATDLRTPFQSAFEVPVVVDNDANVAAVGEGWLGAGRGYARIAMVTIGTGIGVASLIDGKVQRASDGRHGEAGHMVLYPDGPRCYCGANGCWEVLASGTAIGEAARQRAWHPDGALWTLAGGEVERIDAGLVFKAAAQGDPEAQAMVDATARWIGLGLVNLASAVTPDIFILAGGVARQFDTMRAGIEAVLHQHVVMIPTDVPVVAASLGDDAGAIGAARLALAQLAGGE